MAVIFRFDTSLIAVRDTLLSLTGTGASLSPGHGRYFCGAKVPKTLSLIFVASLWGSAWAIVYRRNKNNATLLLILGRCGDCRVCEFSDEVIR